MTQVHYLRQKAIELRKAGLSYSEILQNIPIAKSTLALWLKNIGLSKPQLQRLTMKRLEASKKGGEVRRERRLRDTKEIQHQAIIEIGDISRRELILIGTALYWAEGSKQKTHSVSERVIFSNSDVEMVKVFLAWLNVIEVKQNDIHFSVYLHETAKDRVDEIRQYWSKSLKLSINRFEKIYFKKGSDKSYRKNVGVAYHGQMRITIRRSTDLNRKIDGWSRAIVKKVAEN